MSEIKGILFDKDGTLVDFHSTWFAIGDMMALHAADQDRERADELLAAGGFDFQIGRFRADSIFAAGTNAEIVALWYPHLTNGARQEMLAEFDRITLESAALNPVELPGCREALTALHKAGLRLGIATNDSTGGAERMLTTLGIAQLFEATYGYDAVANPKPAPDTLFAFSDLTGLKPFQLAMVGDNSHDLEMARAGGAGLAVGVLTGTGTRQSLAPLADVVLDSIAELPDFLASRSRKG